MPEPRAKSRMLYDNLLAKGVVTASSTDTGFSVDNLKDFRPFTFWKPAPGASVAEIVVDLSEENPIPTANYLAIYNHSIYSKRETPGTPQLILQAAMNPQFDPMLPTTVTLVDVPVTSDDTFLFLFTPPAIPSPYWRLTIQGMDPSNPPEMAIVAFGSVLEIPTTPREGFDPIGRQVEGITNTSMKGHPIGKVIEWESWKQSVTFELLTWNYVRNDFLPAWTAHLSGKPFLFVWDFEDRPKEIFLVNAGDAFSTPHRAGQLTELRIDLSGVAT